MAFSRVQGRNHQNGASSSTTVACGSGDGLTAIASGNLVVVEVGWASTAGDTVTGITDNQSNTYTLTDLARETTVAYSYQTAYRANITNGPVTITATLSASRTFAAITVQEYSGVLAASPLDGHAIQAQRNPGTGANAVSSGNATPATNGCLIFGATVNVNGSGAPGYGTGYTGRDNFSNTFESEDKTQAAAAATAATFTAGNAGDGGNSWITALLGFKPVSFVANHLNITRQALHRAAYW
jgi:hypothetical protein